MVNESGSLQQESSQTNPPPKKGGSRTGCIIMAVPAAIFVITFVVWLPIAHLLVQTGSASIVRYANLLFGFLSVGSLIATPICVVIGFIVIVRSKK